MSTAEPIAPVVAPEASPAAAAVEIDTVDTRAEVLKAELRAERVAPKPDAEAAEEGPGDDEGEPAETPEPTEGDEAEEPEKQAAAPPVVDKIAEERKAALKRAADLEKKAHGANERVLAREARAAERERAADERIAAAEKRAAEAEQVIAWRERIVKDPAEALDYIGKHVDPAQLGDWMVKSQDPVTRAEWATKKALEEAQREASKPNAEIAEMRAEMAALKEERRMAQLHATREREERAVAETAQKYAADVPLAARMAAKMPAQFNSLVHAMASTLRAAGEPLSYERIVERVEEELSGYADVYAPKNAAGTEAPSAAPAPAPASKARTLSSRTTAGRSTLASHDEKVTPLEERADDLVQRIRRGDSFA